MIDMSLEMISLDALDTGQYHAMVVQDPGDKREIRGFFHMAIAYSESMRNRDWHDFTTRKIIAIKRLSDAMNKYTNIRTDVTVNVPFTSGELLKIPWVYASTHLTFPVTYSDAQNLGQYLMVGGFFSGDGNTNPRDPGTRSLRELVIEALRTQGFEHEKDWTFEVLPNTHSLYHCYFDFDRPPGSRPRGSDKSLEGWSKGIDGIVIQGRMVATISSLWLWHPWADWSCSWSHWNYEGNDPTRLFQFGINMIVFALTQEGSITNRVMDSVR